MPMKVGGGGYDDKDGACSGEGSQSEEDWKMWSVEYKDERVSEQQMEYFNIFKKLSKHPSMS